VESTCDTAFEREIGLELLVETARLWRSLGYHDEAGRFHIDGVTGPDEYSALADNNVYTNLMAQHNLYAAAETARRYPSIAHTLNVSADEIKSWHDAAAQMVIPYDKHLGITPQDDTFTRHARWNFAETAPDQYPLLLYFPYFDLYRKQVVKQADLVLAMQHFSEAFTLEQKARNFAYYEPLTVRDSSLSAATQAVLAAEVGQLQLAYDYLGESALMDLDDLEHNTRDGLHIASLAGTWTILVAGFGGLRFHKNALSFAPRLPDGITRLVFRMMFRNRLLRVEVTAQEAKYSLLEGEPLKTRHYGTEIGLSTGHTVTCPIHAIKAGPRPMQPPGREPAPRGPHKPHEKRERLAPFLRMMNHP
jgi:alpha,alpha-trehalose phosphorylase